MCRKSKLVEDHEKVDCDVDDVDDEAAEIALGNRAEEDGHVDNLVDTLHGHNEAEHDGETQVDEATDCEDFPLFLPFRGRWHDRLTHLPSTSQC